MGKYLGLRSTIIRDRTTNFTYIKDSVRHQINSWSSKCLPKSGREVVIKSSFQVILSYVMSNFQLPYTIENMMNSFWWGHGSTNQHGINWLSYEKLFMHKFHGGMGFKDLLVFNLAMLGKQGWNS